MNHIKTTIIYLQEKI